MRCILSLCKDSRSALVTDDFVALYHSLLNVLVVSVFYISTVSCYGVVNNRARDVGSKKACTSLEERKTPFNHIDNFKRVSMGYSVKRYLPTFFNVKCHKMICY